MKYNINCIAKIRILHMSGAVTGDVANSYRWDDLALYNLFLTKRLRGASRSGNRSIAAAITSAVLLGATLPASAQERVLGVDVSYWNRGSSSAAADGITQAAWNSAFNTPNASGYTQHFVWARATRGGTTGLSQSSGTPSPGGTEETLSRRYDDPEFLRTMTRAATAGFFAGPYHFSRPDVVGNTGADEADHMMEYASAYMRPGYLMPVFDLEAGGSLGGSSLAQFSIDFSNRLYDRIGIRPAIYINGSYSSILQGATLSQRDQLAKPASLTPSVTSPGYPMLWNARYANQSDPESIPIQTSNPKATASTFYGPWDDYGDSQPWSFWQYASTVSIPGINTADSTVDANVAQGDIEYVKNYLVPALWWHDLSGDWGTMANWNSGQPLSTFNPIDLNKPPAPYLPRFGVGQTTPFLSYILPTPRLPGTAGSGPAPTTGVHDTVILERPNANLTVTLSSGGYNIRKLYMRETLNIAGGSLTINYNPTYRPDSSPNVLHGGPLSAQFSGPVTLSGGDFTVHTLQVDATRTFILGGGTVVMNRINLMPHSTAPARILVTGNVNIDPLSNDAAIVAKGGGSGISGRVDLDGANRSLTVGDGAANVDLSIDVPIINGGLTKLGAGTLQLSSPNSYSGGTIVSAGDLLVSNTTDSGTGSGGVTVNGGRLIGTGMIAGAVSVNVGGTIAPGTTASLGTLKLGAAPTFNGTSFLRINRNAESPISDRVAVTSGSLTYGGTLEVSNVGATLVGGEVFMIFSASSYAGGFSNTILPPLGNGLNWFTGELATNGAIRVNRQPVATPLAFSNTAPAVLEIPFATLIANATDPDGNPLTVNGVDLTTTNGVTLTTNSTSIVYSNHQTVTDQFSYTIGDGHGGSATGIVDIENTGSTPEARFVSSPSVDGSSVLLNFDATPGWTYYLERSTDLLAWFTIWTDVAPPSGVLDYTDDFQDLDAPPSKAFYRVRWQE